MRHEFEELQKEFESRKPILHRLLHHLENLQQNIKTICDEDFSNSIQRKVESSNSKLEEFEKKFEKWGKSLEELCKVHVVTSVSLSYKHTFLISIK